MWEAAGEAHQRPKSMSPRRGKPSASVVSARSSHDDRWGKRSFYGGHHEDRRFNHRDRPSCGHTDRPGSGNRDHPSHGNKDHTRYGMKVRPRSPQKERRTKRRMDSRGSSSSEGRKKKGPRGVTAVPLSRIEIHIKANLREVGVQVQVEAVEVGPPRCRS